MRYILIILFLSFTNIVFSQSLEFVNAKVNNDKIQIDFKLKGIKKYQEIPIIQLFVKKQYETEFNGPMKNITYRTSLKNGDNTIYWDALSEMAIENENLIFDLRANVVEKDRIRRIILMYVGNGITPIGVRFGQLGKVSWFLELRSSFNPNINARYTYNKGIIEDYDQISYRISGQKKWKAYAGIAAITVQFFKGLHYYAGAGYGIEYRIFQLEHFAEDMETIGGDGWAIDKDHHIEGIAIDSGIIFNYKSIVLGVSGTSIELDNFNWKASIGLKL